MLTLVHAPRTTPAAPFVEIVTANTSGRDVGHRLGGHRAGPTLLVATGPGLYNALHRRLSALPNLPWMRGSLLLVRLSNIHESLNDEWIDDIVSLPQAAADPASITQAYWTVLRKATVMGMIGGRGVPIGLVA